MLDTDSWWFMALTFLVCMTAWTMTTVRISDRTVSSMTNNL